MKKAIEITVLRVSSNGKYIEFIMNCPKDYYFTDFRINVLGKDDDIYSLKESLFLATEEDDDKIWSEIDELWYHNRHYYVGQFKVEDIGVTVPEIYKVELTAYHNPEIQEDEDLDPCDAHPKVLTAEAYISDVSKAYYCLSQDILSAAGSDGQGLCGNDEVMDRVIRNYLILYAHQEAMHLHYLDDARKYFTLLQRCFSVCGGEPQFMGGSCKLCNGGSLTEFVRFDTYKPISCGCIK